MQHLRAHDTIYRAMQTEVMTMAGFIPKDKLSKKAKKELNRRRRKTWDFSPVTKTVESRKLYNRKRNARGRYDDYGAGASLCSEILSVPSPVIARYVTYLK